MNPIARILSINRQASSGPIFFARAGPVAGESPGAGRGPTDSRVNRLTDSVAPILARPEARRDSVRRRDRVRQLEELRRALRLGSLIVPPILFGTAVLLGLRYPTRGLELFALWTAEAAAVAALHPLASLASRRRMIRLTLLFAFVPAIGLPITLALEPGTLLQMNSAFATLPVAVPLFLAWPRPVRTAWLVGYAAAFGAIALITGFGHIVGSARTDIAVDTLIGCLIGWAGGELLERPRLRSIDHDLELRRLNRVLRGHATTDALTGLANRRQLETDLGLLAVSLSQSDAPCGVLIFDLDRFKRLNDALGHVAGDEALRLVAAELGRIVRGRDTIYRYGGEEFLAILPNTQLAAALEVAERIRLAIEGLSIPSSLSGNTTLTISGGVAVAIPPHPDWDRVLALADAALFTSKTEGRNRIGSTVIETSDRGDGKQERPAAALVRTTLEDAASA